MNNCEKCTDNRPRVGRLAGVTRTMRLAIYEGEGVPTGTPQDLSGLTVVVRVLRDGTTDIFTPGFVIEGESNNVVKFEWPAERQTVGDYTFDVTMTDGSGNINRVDWHGPHGIRLVAHSFQVYGEDAIGVESNEEVGLIGYFTSNGVGMSAYDEWIAQGHTGTEADFIAWLRQPADDAATDAQLTVDTKMAEVDAEMAAIAAQASSDHFRAGTDHGTAASDHTTAAADHLQAQSDHATAVVDSTNAGLDHTRAGEDHDVAAADHTQASSDHTQAASDHTTAAGDHTTAAADHTQAASDHTQAASDHTTAAGDHTTAAADHTQAVADHAVMAGYDTRLGDVEDEVSQLGQEVDGMVQDNPSYDFAIADENGNSIAGFSNGHIRTNKFNSEDIVGIKGELSKSPKINVGDDDFSIVDDNGHILVKFHNGGIETLNFDSANVQRALSYVVDVISRNFPTGQTAQYVGEKIHINRNGFSNTVWGTFTGLSMSQSFSIYGDYIVFIYGAPNYGSGSLWRISTKEKLADLTFPHEGYAAPHGNVSGFSGEFKAGNSDLPLLYVSQWDNEGGCFVYDIHIDGTVNLVQTIMTDGNMGADFGLALGDWVLDYENGFIWSAKYKVSAYHAADNGMMFCKFRIPSTENSSVVLAASDILDSFEIDDKTADLTITQGKVINAGKMFIVCGYGDSQYPGMLYVIDLLGKKLSSYLNLSAIGSGEPEGLEILDEKLLYSFGGSTIYSLTF